jgi:hypothetical protein
MSTPVGGGRCRVSRPTVRPMMTPQNPINRAVDKCFDAMQTVLSAQRSMVQFTLTTSSASLVPFVERLTQLAKTT